MAMIAPIYDDGTVTLYHGDCRDILPTLGPVDGIVTDPPYGVGYRRGTWDDSLASLEALLRWFVPETRRLVPCGWVMVAQAVPTCAYWHRWWPEGWRILAACKTFAPMPPVVALPYTWDAVIAWSHGRPSWPDARCGVVRRDWVVINTAVAGVRPDHPCPKHLDWGRYCVELAVPPGGTVLDPFAGSGTTLLAAQQLGRRAIGVEINRTYCERIVARVRGDRPLWTPSLLALGENDDRTCGTVDGRGAGGGDGDGGVGPDGHQSDQVVV